MKKEFFIIFFVSLFVISCSKSSNPVSNDDEVILPSRNCVIIGVEIDFVDTCSYNFATSFLSDYDSVSIIYKSLGSKFYISADSGDFNYWNDYFSNDQTIKYIFNVNQSSNPLLMEFILTGEKSIEEEKERFEQIEHLTITKIEESSKTVTIDVPENNEDYWAEYFSQYPFIEEAFVIAVCED